jgi:hypothetical protein
VEARSNGARLVRRPLTAQERDRLRALIDVARRRQIQWDDEPRCSGCGVEHRDASSGEDRYTVGCRTCSERRCGRRKRAKGETIEAP